MDLPKKIIISLIILIVILIIFKQTFLYTSCMKLLYVLIILMTVVAISYEMRDSGCSFFKCEDSDVQKIISNNDLACTEANRVCWRRSIIISTVILIILNIVNKQQPIINLLTFFILFFVLYFVFNFEQYHRFRILCTK